MDAKTARVLLALMAVSLSSGCGLEGLLNLYAGTDYQQPVTVIRGTVALPNPTLTLWSSTGEELTPFSLTVSEEQYELQLISGEYTGLLLRAEQGQGLLEAYVPALKRESVTEGVNIDVASTATVKFVEGLMGVETKTLPRLSADLLCIMGKRLSARYDDAGPVGDVYRMMSRVADRADLASTSDTRVFQTAVVTPEYLVEDSPLDPGWVGRTLFDYDGNGSPNQTTDVFDAAYVSALQTLELQAPGDPDLIRVVLSVDFNEGKLDGACGQIDRFRWTTNKPGKQMFFVGGIHQTSPVQDPQVDAMLGNRGGWTPNVIQMYDDGTNGDQQAGDNIWSIYFDLPRGVRIGYKYTWGNQGDLWTGTEEWPGNQRILEVVDNNNDTYVYRLDNYGDEATNKDLANGNPSSGGSLDWNEDLDGDGYPEAQEEPIDVDNDCGPDEFVTPEWVPALTLSCEAFVAE